MPLAQAPAKEKEVFPLIGMRAALYQLFVEALMADDIPAKEAAVSFIHIRNIEKYEPIEQRKPFPPAPYGWECSSMLNGKSILYPVFAEGESVEEIVCFVYCTYKWYPFLIKSQYGGIKSGAKIVELFGFSHTTWPDLHAVNAQHVLSIEMIDSAETVLRVPGYILDYILTHK